MHNHLERDKEVLRLFYNLNAGQPYRPASYSSVREFVDSFPQKEKPKFVPDTEPTTVYTKDYRKTILSTL